MNKYKTSLILSLLIVGLSGCVFHTNGGYEDANLRELNGKVCFTDTRSRNSCIDKRKIESVVERHNFITVTMKSGKVYFVCSSLEEFNRVVDWP